MSTLMMMRAKLDPQLAGQFAQQNPNPFAQLAESNHEGLLRHRVFAADGELVVIDEWERPEDFQQWWSSPEVTEIISRMMADGGVTDQPQVVFAEEIDLGDKIG